MKQNVKGFAYGIATSATFGLIPLFTLPMMAKGMEFGSILFYRFLFATLLLSGIMLMRGESFRAERRDIPMLLMVGLFYTISSMFLMWGYEFMAAGVATTIHFTYPIFVTVIMTIFFRERVSCITIVAILLAICGVARLSIGEGEVKIDALAVFIVLLSAVGYALYIVTVNKSRLNTMSGRKLTFYAFSISTVMFWSKVQIEGSGLQQIPDWQSWACLLLLALVPTIISNMTLIHAVHYIGGTLTAVLGAMEPLTAVCVGILVFSEQFTYKMALGLTCIIIAVTLVILSKTIRQAVRNLLIRCK